MLRTVFRFLRPLLGHHVLLLTFRDPVDGRRRERLLEVIDWDRQRKEAVVIALRGRDASWYRAALAGKAQRAEVGGEWLLPVAREVDGEEAFRLFSEYEHRYRFLQPLARPVVSRLAGFHYDGSAPARRRLLAEKPLVGIAPAPVPGTA